MANDTQIADHGSIALQWGTCMPSALSSALLWPLRARLARGAMRRPLRSALRALSEGIDIEVDGLKMRCHIGDNFTENRLLERGQYDAEMIKMITGNLRPGDVFVDVGANCGLYTMFAARAVGPTGRVLAIEPIAAMLDRAHFNAEANGFDHASFFQCSVGDARGEMTLYMKDEAFGITSSTPIPGGWPVTVPVMPLLDLVKLGRVRKIDAMKIDVEGHEDRSLLPFFDEADTSLWPRLLLLEQGHKVRWQEDCVAWLLANGYSVEWESTGDILLRRGP